MTTQQSATADSLSYFVNRRSAEDLVLRLFVNDVTPTETDTAASYTEASGNGYAAIPLDGANWSEPTVATPSVTTYPEQIFTFTGPIGDVYGFFITRATSGDIAAAHRFTDGPYRIQNSADEIAVEPGLTSENLI